MQSLILTLHIIVCVLLVILILLQSGKEGMGVIFGGGNSSVFGSAGAGGILAKLTTLIAIIFIITSLSYTYVTSSRPATESVILDVHIEEPATPPSGVETPQTPADTGNQNNTDAAKPVTATPTTSETAPAATQDSAPAAADSQEGASPQVPDANPNAAENAAPKAE